jgi:NADH-ubiquinone oxidoreductase chain 6
LSPIPSSSAVEHVSVKHIVIGSNPIWGAQVFNIMEIPLYDIKILTILIWSTAVLLNFAVNPVHAAIYLILSFILSSILLFNMGLILISYIYIIVYVGAIAILFLFIVMLLDLQESKLTKKPNGGFFYFQMGSIFLIYFQIFKILISEYYTNSTNFSEYYFNALPKLYNFHLIENSVDTLDNYIKLFLSANLFSFDINKMFGHYLYVQYGEMVLVLGLVLFIAMVLAIYLVKPVKDNE